MLAAKRSDNRTVLASATSATSAETNRLNNKKMLLLWKHYLPTCSWLFFVHALCHAIRLPGDHIEICSTWLEQDATSKVSGKGHQDTTTKHCPM